MECLPDLTGVLAHNERCSIAFRHKIIAGAGEVVDKPPQGASCGNAPACGRAFQTWYYLLLKPDTPYPKSCTSVASYCEADCVLSCLQEVLQELNYDEEVNNIRYCYKVLPFAPCFRP